MELMCIQGRQILRIFMVQMEWTIDTNNNNIPLFAFQIWEV
jgi:hypothetical protein